MCVCVCVFGTLWGLHSSSCTTHFGLSLKLGFRGNVCVLDRTSILLQSCVNTCKQTESSSSGSLAFQVDLIKYVELAGKRIAYEELDSLFLFEIIIKRNKEHFEFKVPPSSVSLKNKMAQIKPENRPKWEVKSSSDNAFDDWDLQ